MPLQRTFNLTLHEATGLPPDVHSLRVAAAFASRTKSTAFSVSKERCSWDTQLNWIVDEAGAGPLSCNLVLRDRDGLEFGAASFPVELGSSNGPSTVAGVPGEFSVAPTAPFRAAGRPGIQMRHPPVAASQPRQPAPADLWIDLGHKDLKPRIRVSYTAAASGGRQAPAAPSPPSQPAAAADRGAAMAAAASSGGGAAEADTERLFSFTVDVRAFQASARLPLNMASVYALLHLPQELTGFLAARGLRVPPRLTPLKTYPAMDIARGSEGALPNGWAPLRRARAAVLLLCSCQQTGQTWRVPQQHSCSDRPAQAGPPHHAGAQAEDPRTIRC
jgi:centrosomal protein CEP120